jgi:hypothetical protein
VRTGSDATNGMREGSDSISYTDDVGVWWTASWVDGARFTASPLATRGGVGASEHARDGFGT